MVACYECGKHGHLSCYGYPSETSVPEVVVCYYCSVASVGDGERPGCSIDPNLSETDAQVSLHFFVPSDLQ